MIRRHCAGLLARRLRRKAAGKAEKERIGQEVADIFIYLIYLCEELNIDMYDEATKKLKLNKNRFPVMQKGHMKLNKEGKE